MTHGVVCASGWKCLFCLRDAGHIVPGNFIEGHTERQQTTMSMPFGLDVSSAQLDGQWTGIAQGGMVLLT